MPLAEQRIVVEHELDVNSAGRDYPAAEYDGGLVYVSTHSATKLRRRLKEPRKGDRALERLYLASRSEDGALDSASVFLPDFTRKVNAGPLAFSTAGDVAYVTRNAAPARSGSRVASRLQIYDTHREDSGAWGELHALEFADATANDAHPSLAADGSRLVFASERDGGYGGLDLWGVRRVNGLWGAPFNLGPAVNSGADEAFPFLHADGTLYFATEVAGEGSDASHYDLAYTREVGGEWAAPTFLGAPFNTPEDDFALIVSADNRSGYFASGREGGLGRDDIYSFVVIGDDAASSRAPAALAVAVTDAETGAPLAGASVVYLDADTTSLATALSREVVTVEGTHLRVIGGDRYMTDIRGEGLIGVREGTFLLEIAREGYESVVLSVAVVPGQTSVPVALSRKRACAQIRISVVEEETVFPVSNALLAAVAAGGEVDPVEVRTGDDGTALVCLPCGEYFDINAVAGPLQGLPVEYDARGDDCGARGARTTLTVYLADRRATRMTGGETTVIAEGAPLAAGTRFQMPAVYYASSDFRLNAAARADLDELGRLMRQFPEMRIELGSHTDATGPAGFNRELSQRRADEARRYLVAEAGIDGPRIVAVGYGESRLRNGCRDGVLCSPALHRENRRTEVTILGDGGYASPFDATAAPGLSDASPSRRPAFGRPLVPEEARPAERYYVISGVFSDRANAEPAAQELRALGYPGVRVETVPGVRGHAVVGGRFALRAAAAQFVRALEEAHGREAFVQRVQE